jgi:Tol biopolymer transport system component
MDSPLKRGFALALTVAAAVAAAAPASASFPGKPGDLSYTSSAGHPDGSTSIWARSPFGGSPREFLPHEDSAERPDGEAISDEDASWAPSGKRFVFARRIGGGNLRLFVTESGMKSARAIPLPEGMYARSPQFAPDGRTIVFVEVISGGDPAEEVTWEAGWNVWRVRTDGSGLRRLGPGDDPIWSPRGGVIAFRDTCGSLKTMRTDGSRVRTIVATTRSNGTCNGVHAPDFSPDGRRIAYAGLHRRGGPDAYEVFTVGVDGRARRRVTTMPRGSNAYEPVWSPNGASIAFHRSGSSASASGLYRVSPSGGKQTRIVAEYTPDLAWQPRR